MRPEGGQPRTVYRGRTRIRLLETSLLPHELFTPLAQRPGSIFLDSALIDPYGLGRWSFLMYDPIFIISSRQDISTFRIGRRLKWEQTNPLHTLRRSLGLFQVESHPSWIPFRGGAAGFFAYELGRQIEKIPPPAQDDLQLPESYLGFYDTVLAYDHILEQWFLCYTDFSLKRPDLEARLRELKILAAKARRLISAPSPPRLGALQSNFIRQDYLTAVERAKVYIQAGEIYQVNLSQRFSAEVEPGKAWELYLRLRETNAAPFAAFIQAGEFQILSSSPERFLRVRANKVETRPIKGTRPRGSTPREDAWFKAQLLASEKDRAELNMIVDLERNDLGRVCEYGSVVVSRHAQCESYARVHHLVSTIEGKLRPSCDPTALLAATFPGGSITGAPKIRAMEIIAELEPHARSVYTGAIGYLGFNGNLDLNIAIRTMIITPNRVTFGAGGGIVIDSAPELEYEETIYKAQALIEALGGKVPGF